MKTGGGWHYAYTINKLRFLALPISSTLYMIPVCKREAYAKSGAVTEKIILCRTVSEAELCAFSFNCLFLFWRYTRAKQAHGFKKLAHNLYRIFIAKKPKVTFFFWCLYALM